ncbi:hypothetical protein IFM89_001767 [Coptis chinensis]|uniref:KIB1-4 beta-propeller domain-containing protein n=1 Tax=Coptis chinensis TaxID=261450 RepID=A0A835HHK5_9MAGN|nr:hypothetical protein IFM89_001767 [Coptis chinensis]
MSQSMLLLESKKKLSLNSQWSEIPPELLDVITTKLTSYVDYLRVRSVCPTWRAILPRKPDNRLARLTQSPWLLLSRYNNDNTLCDTHCCFYNLAERRTYSLELPEVIGDKKQCWGSPYGWLVYGQEGGPLISLLNPLTRAQIQLPSLFYYPSTSPNEYNIVLPWDLIGYLADCTIVKAVLFGNPSLSSDFSIMALMEGGICSLAYYRSGTEAWSLFTDTEEISFGDVICFKGEYYGVDLDGHVYHCHLGVSPNVARVIDAPEPLPDDDPEQKYLVESSNELFMVYRYLEHDYDGPFEPTYWFILYKLDWNELTWCLFENLGDQVLFLGANGSFSLSVQDYPFCQENSVYFTDDMRIPVDEPDLDKFKVGPVRGHDLGVFNIHHGVAEPIPNCPVPDPDTIEYMLPPPVWVTLSL